MGTMPAVSGSLANIDASRVAEVARLAAAQHEQGTIAVAARRLLWIARPTWRAMPQRPISPSPRISPMTGPTAGPKPREFFIQGLTRDGQTFRPSDWAERLAGAV